MTYKIVYVVPDPGGAHHFDDYALALEFAKGKGLGPGRILADFYTEAGELVAPPLNAQALVDAEIRKAVKYPPDFTDGDWSAPSLRIAPPDDHAQDALKYKTPELKGAQASAPLDFAQAPEITPQDLGAPSPVPYSLFMRRPSADIDLAGRESTQVSITRKDLQGIVDEVVAFAQIAGLGKFITEAFEGGFYRLELIVGDISIKVYKHPNNP
jgi:hypothetical protein